MDELKPCPDRIVPIGELEQPYGKRWIERDAGFRGWLRSLRPFTRAEYAAAWLGLEFPEPGEHWVDQRCFIQEVVFSWEKPARYVAGEPAPARLLADGGIEYMLSDSRYEPAATFVRRMWAMKVGSRGTFDFYESRGAAIAAWNRRAEKGDAK